MRLGIYGGTFSPPHKGHIGAAEAFYREMQLDKLLIIPTFTPPHKECDDIASPKHRMEMCKLAFSHIPNTEVSDIEIKRGGKSYTYLTLEELSGEGVELFFLCGTDMILTFDCWRRYEYIFSLADICYVRRECDEEICKNIEEKIGQYENIGARIHKIDYEVTEISSSEIRNSVCDFAYKYLTVPVYSYILEHKLFGISSEKNDFFELYSFVKSKMSNKRFEHTLGVEAAAIKIAQKVAPNLIYKARISSILHDVTKEMSQTELIKKYSLILEESDIRSAETLHAITAVEFIKDNLVGFSYDDVLFAISTHTTGAENMTLLGKILFVADYIEEGRRYESSKSLREKLYFELENSHTVKLGENALNKAVVESIEYTLNHLEAKGCYIHPKTILTRDYVKSQIF